ncbi:RecD3 [Desulfamplus magnetovallimortis]|uniref:RecD3 n=1 Tax=Desulfamplus magnetovallimortis TaxID=1246637 RepID=A0A1W1HJJ3_9BACT|nr:ATP-dependent RecD-like DNA helicase [Desulfamplus magnetovallimortis]SLM32630.1 RecD3 [Desulfamplus magnetovallimortis]
MITINGTLQKITFRNEDNHYTIARLKIPESKEAVTIVGHLAGVTEGENLKLTGKWVSHAKYGEQFKVESFAVTLPDTVSGIRKYLASGIIQGIGKSMARRIVEHFKAATLEIIENEPERLMEIEGIGKNKLMAISSAWDKHHAVRKVMQFLQEKGIGITHASAILNYYGKGALKILKEKPYRLSRDIPEAGFNVADTIALQNGVERNDPERIKASILYLLIQNESDGHAYAEKRDIIQRCMQLTGTDEETVQEALDALKAGKEIVIEAKKIIEPEALVEVYVSFDSKNQLNKETLQDIIYSRKMHRAETTIALKIKAMLSVPVPAHNLDEETITREVFTRLALKLSEEQVDIIRQILGHRVVVITGGPGTGKTTLVRAVCAVFRKLKKKVMLSAPTGRAARRLSEVTDRKASTLHRMLLYDPDADAFNRNQDNPLDTDVVVVDEASMVDTYLMYHLVCAVPVNSILVLVGDIFQLPSVGPGNVLSDIINCGAVTTFSLTRIFRQAEESPIVLNAHSIRRGEMPLLENRTKEQGLSEFYFIEANDADKVVRIVSDLCCSRIKNAFPHVDDIQVLTPMHKGEAGTINLNQKLQEVLNDRPGGLESRGVFFKIGDKVMHLKNNYEKEVFNGDIGVVEDVIKSENRLVVNYDGRLVDYDLLELDELALAYAVSVHKSQGSEYSAVVIAMTTMHYPLLQRNLLYTAMTRGRELVIIVGSRRALEIALKNNKTDMRLSGLKDRLCMGL